MPVESEASTAEVGNDLLLLDETEEEFVDDDEFDDDALARVLLLSLRPDVDGPHSGSLVVEASTLCV